MVETGMLMSALKPHIMVWDLGHQGKGLWTVLDVDPYAPCMCHPGVQGQGHSLHLQFQKHPARPLWDVGTVWYSP